MSMFSEPWEDEVYKLQQELAKARAELAMLKRTTKVQARFINPKIKPDCHYMNSEAYKKYLLREK